MRLTPPKKLTFWIAIILGALGLISKFVHIPFVSTNSFWFVVIGFVLLVLGLLVKGF